VRQWIADSPILQAIARQKEVNLFGHRFITGAFAYIEPLKDASADLLRLRNAMISPRRRAAERNLDYQDLVKEICDDNGLMIESAFQRAEELNQKYPSLGVTWREVASLPTPDGVKITLNAAAPEEQPDASE